MVNLYKSSPDRRSPEGRALWGGVAFPPGVRWVWAASLALALTACPAPSGSDGGQDAGEPDAGSPADGGGAADAGDLITTIRVHYPQLSALWLRGSLAPLDWNHGLPMQRLDADTWSLSFTGLDAGLELKPLLGDVTWSRGPNYRAQPGQTVDVFPHFNQVAGQWSVYWPTFTSTVLANTRAVYVYLPPTAVENPLARFPVVYMHDGQNLFDPAAAFAGVTWQVADAMDLGAEAGTIAEAIVVGPNNAGAARIAEYTPVPDPGYGGGDGDKYLSMLITELKPLVDSSLPTLPAREHTVMIGSSLGGLISAYTGVSHPDVFGSVGVMSPSVWWDSSWIVGQVDTTHTSPDRPLKVYVDCGTVNDGEPDTTTLVQHYRALGYVDGVDLLYVVQQGADHSEMYWAQRLPAALEFLLGPGR
jgi:predicted alpha/beta superfamily hydrolase